MKDAKTKIDVFNGTLSMKFDGDVVNFKINEDEILSNNVSVSFVDTNSPLPEYML